MLFSLEPGGVHAFAYASGSSTTATILRALHPNARVVRVNDVYVARSAIPAAL
ncbi:hypothetical protein CPB84DRAFT_1791506 [Gymnopilus junonius]|uniref:Uncharacterized protein n=1 Tax=Gymnopilus junonius TaxID=109634 RepID=A0A9P5NDD6_GYMJU|nr:hypothetical protein CPB84DRAFT_1791506 [Gymnopilus junonius]